MSFKERDDDNYDNNDDINTCVNIRMPYNE
jgi:hypothetical protein